MNFGLNSISEEKSFVVLPLPVVLPNLKIHLVLDLQLTLKEKVNLKKNNE